MQTRLGDIGIIYKNTSEMLYMSEKSCNFAARYAIYCFNNPITSFRSMRR